MAHNNKQGQEEGEEEDCFHEAETQSLAAIDEIDRVYQRVHMLESVIVDIFSTISALKNAYIQLQAAHSPYNADKLRAADRLVIGELRKLSELKHMLKAKQLTASSTSSSSSGRPGTTSHQHHHHQKMIDELQLSLKEKQAVIESYESHMQLCQKELVGKSEEIEQLKESLKRASSRKEKLEKRLNEVHLHLQQQTSTSNGGGGNLLAQLSPPLFEQLARAAKEQAFGFAKMLIGLMKNAEWDLEAAANSIQPGVVYARPLHTRFAFESYVCHRMFNGFENENFYLSGSLSSILDPGKHRQDCFLQFQDMKSADPMDLLAAQPDCLFGKFCHKKYLQIVHEKMEESFFGQLQHRNQVLSGEHPRSQFYHKFLELAKSVWLLHRLAFSFNPTASIFQVRKDTCFHPEFMDSVVDDLETEDRRSPPSSSAMVGFTVMPGFRLDNAVFKCLVYLNRPQPALSHGGQDT